jgi:hypothetical protein
MTDLATLALAIDSSQVAQANRALDAFQAAGTKTQQTAKQLATAQMAWTESLAATDPVLKAQIAMQRDLAAVQKIGAEAVRLGIATQQQATAQLDKVRRGHEALIETVKRGSFSQTTFGQAVTGVQGQLVALSAGAGPVGVFLSSLGPWGLAAAAGIGVAGSALEFFTEQAERMGQKANAVRNLADSTGFAINEIKTLGRTAGQLGVDGGQVETWLERFSAALDDARRGTGPLADAIHRISPELLTQLEATKSNAAAWDVLSSAADRAGLSVQQLLREAFGRGGAQAGLVLAATREAGGLVAMVDKQKESLGVTEDQTRKWAALTNEIDATKKRTENIWGSIFADEVLEKQKASAEFWERIAVAAKKFVEAKGGIANATTDVAARAAGSIGGAMGGPIGGAIAIGGALLSQGIGQSAQGTPGTAFDSWEGFVPGVKKVTEATDSAVKAAISASAAYANFKREVDGLGQAATIQQRLMLELGRIRSEVELKNISPDQGKAREAVANANAINEAETPRIGVLAEVPTLQSNRQSNEAGETIGEEESAHVGYQYHLPATAQALPRRYRRRRLRA